MIKRVRVHGELREGYTVEARVRNHTIVMDLPQPLGSDKGPTPVDVMLASLAGCIGAVARHHAKSHNIELKSLKIVIEGEYDTAGFEGRDVKPGMHYVRADIIVESPNSEEELRRFFEFVEKHCPVSDTFTSTTKVEFTLKRKG